MEGIFGNMARFALCIYLSYDVVSFTNCKFDTQILVELVLAITSIKQPRILKGQHFVIPDVHFCSKTMCIEQPLVFKCHFIPFFDWLLKTISLYIFFYSSQ